MDSSGSLPAFPTPQGGASLLLSFQLQAKIIVIVGSGPLAASRAFSALEADASVVVLAKGGLGSACEELRWRAQDGQLTILDLDSLPTSQNAGADRDTAAFQLFLEKHPHKIRFVFITDTLLSTEPSKRRTHSSAAQLCRMCSDLNILVNVTDMPDLCDFSFASTHRFESAESRKRTALQIGVTTNGKGCRLAARLRREIVAKLPKDVGMAVDNVGKLRELIKAADEGKADECLPYDELNEDNGLSTPNRPVPSRSTKETAFEGAKRRMKWVAQVSEYWPMSSLAMMTESEMESILNENGNTLEIPRPSSTGTGTTSMHSLALSHPRPSDGRIFLVGSGPGHPSLLTLAAFTALTKFADLVLSDKLVPDAILAMVPSHVEIRIARKFPGNAEGAQNEMMEVAVEFARKGLTVVRLKQGDPVVYGRTGEEVLYFRSHGFEPTVIPGVSSALAAPIFAGIPVTQRGVAESFIVCTGVGRKGKDVRLPGYERGRTLVILMGVARLTEVVSALLERGGGNDGESNSTKRRDGPAYPPYLPIALIERGSMLDQRVVSSTLQNIATAHESVGEQRPPGMFVVGWAVLALWDKGDVDILEEGAVDSDEERVEGWLGGERWRVKEGLDVGWMAMQYEDVIK